MRILTIIENNAYFILIFFPDALLTWRTVTASDSSTTTGGKLVKMLGDIMFSLETDADDPVVTNSDQIVNIKSVVNDANSVYNVMRTKRHGLSTEGYICGRRRRNEVFTSAVF